MKLPRTLVIYHGVAERPSLPFFGHTPKFAFIGRLVSTKGIDLLLRASHKLWNKGLQLELLIIGDGPERQSLADLCSQLGIAQRVHFVGQIADHDVEALLRDAIAVVMPSVAGEVFGLVAAESMMRGRVIIVPDRGPLAEIAGQSGLKFAAGDVNALAASMEKLMQSPGIAIDLGGSARDESLNTFRVAKMLDGHMMLYEEVLK